MWNDALGRPCFSPTVSGTQDLLALCHLGSQRITELGLLPVILLTAASSVLTGGGGSCLYKELCLAQDHPIQEVIVVKAAGKLTPLSAQSTSMLWDILYSLCSSLPGGSEGRACLPTRDVCAPGDLTLATFQHLAP